MAIGDPAEPAETTVWRRIPSNFGLPVWIDAADLKKAQASKAKKRTVRILSPGPFTANSWNPAADYSLSRSTYFCEEGAKTEDESYFNADGSLVRKDVRKEKQHFIPGVVDVTIYRVVCQGEAIDGDVVELGSIGGVLAYPKPQRPPPHP